MNQKSEYPTISFSQEELFVILTYLKVPTLIGLDNRILTQASEEQARLALGIAERALIARGGLVRDESHHFQLEPTVLALTGACAAPETSLIVARSRPALPVEPYFYHTARQMVVLHTIPITAIHQFIMLEDRAALIRSTMSIVDLDAVNSALNCPAGRLTEALLQRTRDAAAKDMDSALQILAESDLDPATREQLAHTFVNPISNVTFAYISQQQSAESKADGFTILTSSNGMWLIRPVMNEQAANKLVEVKPVSRRDIEQAFNRMLGQ